MTKRKPREVPLILVVEDDPQNLELLDLRLRSEGYEIVSTSSGEDSYQLAAELQPDLILMDLKLPGVDGYKVYESLRATKGTEQVPVIFVTSWVEDVPEVDDQDADFVAKPFSWGTLRSKIEKKLKG